MQETNHFLLRLVDLLHFTCIFSITFFTSKTKGVTQGIPIFRRNREQDFRKTVICKYITPIHQEALDPTSSLFAEALDQQSFPLRFVWPRGFGYRECRGAMNAPDTLEDDFECLGPCIQFGWFLKSNFVVKMPSHVSVLCSFHLSKLLFFSVLLSSSLFSSFIFFALLFFSLLKGKLKWTDGRQSRFTQRKIACVLLQEFYWEVAPLSAIDSIARPWWWTLLNSDISGAKADIEDDVFPYLILEFKKPKLLQARTFHENPALLCVVDFGSNDFSQKAFQEDHIRFLGICCHMYHSRCWCKVSFKTTWRQGATGSANSRVITSPWEGNPMPLANNMSIGVGFWPSKLSVTLYSCCI